MWMFFEYVDGIPFDREDPEHRRGAARLAARLHNLQPTDAELAILPQYFAPHYQQRLLDAADRLRTYQIATGTMCPSIVGRVRARLENVLESWDFVEQCFRDHPARIVHGDFTGKNLFVRRSEASIHVVAIDWDTVGFGYRFVDLQCADIHEYCSVSGLGADSESNEDVAAALRVGLTLRLIDSVAWTVTKLQGPSIDRPVRHLESYDRAFADHLPLGPRAARTC
jgi:Ser/Thr protein kinase RdoA (MazF antagonist)